MSIDIVNTLKTVNTVVTIAKPIIETVTTKLTPEMKNFAERLYTLSEKYPSLEKLAEAIDKAAEIIVDVLFLFNIKCDSATEMGFKVEQAEKAMSDFESVENYINYLHDEIELDKIKFDSLSNEEKMAYEACGMAVGAEAIAEKIGVDISPDFIMLMSKIKVLGEAVIETAELVTILKGLKDNGIEKTEDVCEYFIGEGESDRVKTGSVIKDVFATVFGDNTEDIIEKIKIGERNT